VRLTYIATLHCLRDARVLRLERHRTNGDYQRLVAARHPELAALLAPATERFDRIWYGAENATPADLDLVQAQLDALRSALPKPEDAAP
jgi:Domain of unknown function (DUF4129)